MSEHVKNHSHESVEAAPVAKKSRKPARAAKAAPAAQPAKTKIPRKPLEPLTHEQRLERGCFEVKEVAQLCACSERIIYQDIADGYLRAVKMHGRVRVLGPDLARFMNTPRPTRKAGGAS